MLDHLSVTDRKDLGMRLIQPSYNLVVPFGSFFLVIHTTRNKPDFQVSILTVTYLGSSGANSARQVWRGTLSKDHDSESTS